MLIALALAPAQAARTPFPHDGFRYPGDPGTEKVIKRYEDRWTKRVASLPPLPTGIPPLLKSFAWMVGSWTAAVRDYDNEGPKKRGIIELSRGPATIAFTPESKWLRIETNAPHYYNVRYIAFDRQARRLVLHNIGSPGAVDTNAALSAGWAGDKATFGPVNTLYYGLPLTDRIVFVREGTDRLRIVTEGRQEDGSYIAVDDTVYTRAKSRAPASKR